MSGVSSAGSRSSPWQRPEQKVNVSSIKKVVAHSYVRYEFVVDTSERKAPWLFRCVSKRDMDRRQRGFHALQKIEEQIRTRRRAEIWKEADAGEWGEWHHEVVERLQPWRPLARLVAGVGWKLLVDAATHTAGPWECRLVVLAGVDVDATV